VDELGLLCSAKKIWTVKPWKAMDQLHITKLKKPMWKNLSIVWDSGINKTTNDSLSGEKNEKTESTLYNTIMMGSSHYTRVKSIECMAWRVSTCNINDRLCVFRIYQLQNIAFGWGMLIMGNSGSTYGKTLYLSPIFVNPRLLQKDKV
jgi:hypothetical protein